jgi:hypothetical protein
MPSVALPQIFVYQILESTAADAFAAPEPLEPIWTGNTNKRRFFAIDRYYAAAATLKVVHCLASQDRFYHRQLAIVN